MSALQKQQDSDQKNAFSGENVLHSEILNSEKLPDNLEDAHRWIRHLFIQLSQSVNNISRLQQSASRLEQSIGRLEQVNLENCHEALNAFD
jgi:hypothetical protein